MSEKLAPIDFPLHGSRLIEASAGTGKTWTIAALYVRLVLGHGADNGFYRPLMPAEILVMTFTRAATRELSDRIRRRLLEAAHCFRSGQLQQDDAFLQQLLAAYPDEAQRLRAAHRLTIAAEAMDDAGIFTIDAWCQRMLREHAFDSGCLFDEELVANEDNLLRDAVRDYWRHHVYALDEQCVAMLLQTWTDPAMLEKDIRPLIPHAGILPAVPEAALGELIRRGCAEREAQLARLKDDWRPRVARMRQWLQLEREAVPKGFNATKMKPADNWLAMLDLWVSDPQAVWPGEKFEKAWERLAPDGLRDACNKGYSINVPADFEQIPVLHNQLAEIEPQLDQRMLCHAARWIAQRMTTLKQNTRRFGFADMLNRLSNALAGPNGDILRSRIVTQFPVALIDEFQDTSPGQYWILDRLYKVAAPDTHTGLFLIGDPKQAIYRFRGADINSYLAARRATAGRHYMLDTNFRSAENLVAAVNHVFLHAEGDGSAKTGHRFGAFHFGQGADNPLPFVPVAAKGRAERFICSGAQVGAVTIWCNPEDKITAEQARQFFAAQCAEQIVRLLNDEKAGFCDGGMFTPLQPSDIAVLVRDGTQAEAVRQALLARRVASVYLSDKESVFNTLQAADLLRWLRAIASPLDTRLARAAYATETAGLPLAELAELASDELQWEARIEQLKEWRQIWQRQGVLAMLRRLIHELRIPQRLLHLSGGERILTDLLHLAELLQTASRQLDGEQALIRWLEEQIENDSDSGDERIQRLESDAGLVKIITIHKSKGLEYPLVFLPFAIHGRPVKKKARGFLDIADSSGQRTIDFFQSQRALQLAETERLQEDLRLLYVALTRARHAMWLGVGAPGRALSIAQSAFGYLLSGGTAVEASALPQLLEQAYGSCAHISIQTCYEEPAQTLLSRAQQLPPLTAPRLYGAAFERNWTVASYSSITRDLGSVPAPVTPQEEKLLDGDDDLPVPSVLMQDAPWHRFPRGARPGQFLHEQLEWMASEGFAIVESEHFARLLAARCERAGWAHRQEDTVTWLQRAASTALPPLGAALCRLEQVVPEMEFWVPASGLHTQELDRHCRQLLPVEASCPPLSERQLNGMLRGFMDLVAEHDGRYWVLDYKSNALGGSDADYHQSALAAAIAANRYEVQGMIYLLALHRLLKLRLGASYDPESQLGGAIFFFLRGLANPDTHGCHVLAPDMALLQTLDALLPAGAATVGEAA